MVSSIPKRYYMFIGCKMLTVEAWLVHIDPLLLQVYLQQCNGDGFIGY